MAASRLTSPARAWLLAVLLAGVPWSLPAGSTARTASDPTPAIGNLLQDLADPDPGAHNRALISISKRRPVPPEVLPALIDLLQDDDWRLRHRALMVLGNLGAEAMSALPEILVRLSDENEHVRRNAASALRRIPAQTREVRLGLVAALDHEDASVRREARFSLEEQAASAADVAPELARRLEHDNHDVRYAASQILGRLAPEAAVPVLIPVLAHGDGDVRNRAAHTLASFGTEAAPAVPTLRGMLREPERRHLAASTLVGLGPAAQPALPELVPLLETSDPAHTLGPVVARALGAIGPDATEALPSLRRALARTNDSEASGRYRTALVQAIGRISANDPAVDGYARRMARSLSSYDPMRRVEAGRALAGLGPSARPALAALRESLREDDEAKIRGLAADALGGIGAEAAAALPDLHLASSDRDPRVRKKATQAIDRIEKSLASARHPEAVPPAASLREAEFASHGPTLAEDIEALGDRSAHVRIVERGPAALPALHGVLLDASADPRRRHRALLLIGEVGDPGSVDPILASLRAHPEEPLAAIDALRVLSHLATTSAGSQFATGLVEDPATHPRVRRQALMYFAAHRDWSSRGFAARFRDDPDPETRAAALYLAARLADPDALTPIVQLLEAGPKASVRYGLLLALAELVAPGTFETQAASHRKHQDEYESALRVSRFRSGSPEEQSALLARMLSSQFPNERRLAIRGLVQREALAELDPYLETWWRVPPPLRALLQSELRRAGYEIVEKPRKVAIARTRTD